MSQFEIIKTVALILSFPAARLIWKYILRPIFDRVWEWFCWQIVKNTNDTVRLHRAKLDQEIAYKQKQFDYVWETIWWNLKAGDHIEVCGKRYEIELPTSEKGVYHAVEQSTGRKVTISKNSVSPRKE